MAVDCQQVPGMDSLSPLTCGPACPGVAPECNCLRQFGKFLSLEVKLVRKLKQHCSCFSDFAEHLTVTEWLIGWLIYFSKPSHTCTGD